MKMKRIRNKILQIMVLQIMVLMCVMIISTSLAYASSGGGYAGWYYVNGMGSVVGSVMDGSMTLPQAIETIVVPAYNAGYVTEGDIDFLIEYYPEAEQFLVIYSVIPAPANTGTPTETPTETAPPVPTYTIEDCDMVKYATTNVNIRSDADANAGLVGSITQNEQAHITGITSNGWYRLEYNGMTGFSVAKYFSDVKVEEVAGVTDTSEVASEPTSEEASEATSETASETVSEGTSEAVSEEPVSESDSKTDIIEEEDVASEEVSEAASEDVETSEPIVTTSEKKTSVLPYILIGAGVLICVGGVVTVVVLNKKKKEEN